ncbi:recombinase family protein [Pseudocitrobacter faecalis]|uniref:recombinase family protein n=1 Tax=Pseudocitrobacter faecalis TaxID=1398493 RepID=UPI00389ACF42
MTKQLITYVRWSSEEQSQGDSLRRQQDYIQKFRDEHPEYESSPEYDYLDRGVSGFKKLKKKPAKMTAEEWEKKRELTMNQLTGDLSRFYKDMRSGKFVPGSVLIVEALDRLSRKPADEAYDDIREITKKFGLNIFTLADGEWYTAKTDLIQILKIFIKQEVANEESQKKSKRGYDNWTGKNEKVVSDPENYTLTSLTPGWIDVHPETRKRTINQAKAETVKNIYLMRDSGMSFIAIAIELNRQGVPTINARKIRKERLKKIQELQEKSKAVREDKATGRKRQFANSDATLLDAMAGNWSRETVKHLLQTETVLGTLPATAKRPAVHNYYPQIISQTLFDSVQLKSRGKPRGKCSATESPLYVNIFRTLMICGHCGLTMTPAGMRPVSNYFGTYRCNGYIEHRKNANGVCDCDTVSRKPFDLNMTARLFANLKVLTVAGDEVQAAPKKDPRLELEEVKTKINNLTQTIIALSAVGVPDAVLAQMTEAKSEQNRLEVEIANSVIRNQTVSGDLDISSLNLIDSARDRTKARDTIAQIVKQVVVFGKDKLCDVYLFNGSVVRGIQYTKEGDLTARLYSATDNQFISELNLISGSVGGLEVSGKITESHTAPDFTDWPESDEPDYPNEEGQQ